MSKKKKIQPTLKHSRFNKLQGMRHTRFEKNGGMQF